MKEGFVVLPRQAYESLLLLSKQSNYLDADTIEALEDVKKGRIIGPFSTLASGLKALKMSK